VPTEQADLYANLLYLALVAGLWLAAAAVVTPGTGILEVLALLGLGLAGAGALTLPVNAWALLGLAAGAALFVPSLRGTRPGLWLALSALALSLGSVFLYASADGSPRVHPALASFVSLLTLGFFWFAIRKSLLAMRARPTMDLTALVGSLGEARTEIAPSGSAQIAGELWSVRSDVPIPAGTPVRVLGRDGLTLVVEPVQRESSPSDEGG
jgi:membrane-bound serine protease (ClpP class)